MLTGLQLSFFSFLHFMYKGVTSADLRHERKMEDLIELFMFFHKNSTKISTFSFSFPFIIDFLFI